MSVRRSLCLAIGLALAGGVWAQPPPPPPPPDSGFLATALARLGMVFRGIGSLSGGARPGELWRVTLPAGERQRVGSASDLAWPVPAPDGRSVYAVRDRQVVRVALDDGHETAVGAPAPWIKLIGVLPDLTVLGFVPGDPRPRPALLSPDGTRTDLAEPVTAEERQRNAALLQDGRDYADGIRLEVRDSTRGGRGRDVFLVTPDGAARNLSDCGDAVCGQVSRGVNGTTVFYVRSSRR